MPQAYMQSVQQKNYVAHIRFLKKTINNGLVLKKSTQSHSI